MTEITAFPDVFDIKTFLWAFGFVLAYLFCLGLVAALSGWWEDRKKKEKESHESL